MRRRRLAVAAVAALALVAVLAAGCAIPTQSAPSTMSPSKVPFDLLNPHPPTTTTTTQPKPSSYVAVQVFFLDTASTLTAVQRFVAAPAPLTAVLGALLDGPSSSDPPGTATAIPNDVRVLSATKQGAVVTVNMNVAFEAITGNTNIEEAVGQIVTTVAADQGDTTGVLFEIEGQHISVPIANGSQVSGPVYLIDFL